MKRVSFGLPTIGFLIVVEVLAGQVPEVLSADLKPETLEGFSRYVRATQARIDKEIVRPGAFLYVDALPEPRRKQAMDMLKRGELFMQRLQPRDASERELRAPGGLIHHWLGAVFIPGVNLPQVRDLVQDYDHHQDIYKPEVVRSRLLSREGNDFKIFYRLRKHKVITVTLNTEHEVHYTPVDATHLHSRSHSTRIAEVEDADRPNEREKPVGHDGGFLWRMDSDWRFEEREGGVYVECESISLTRDIPMGLGWLIGPFITAIPKESLQNTLTSTRSAGLARLAAAQKN
jgi:hypothetical protein